MSVSNYLQELQKGSNSARSANNQISKQPLHTFTCNQCNQQINENTSFSYCKKCLEDLRDAGWFDTGW